MATNPYVNKVVVNNQTLIDLTADTVDAAHLAQGYTAHDLSGAPIVGTMTRDTPAITTYTINNTRVFPTKTSSYSEWETAVINGGGKLEIDLQQLGITSWTEFGAMFLTCIYWSGTSSYHMGALIYRDGNNLKLVIDRTGEQTDLSQSPTVPHGYVYLSFPDMGGTGYTPIGTLSTSSASLQHFRLQSFYKSGNTSGQYYGDAVEIRQGKVFKID